MKTKRAKPVRITTIERCALIADEGAKQYRAMESASEWPHEKFGYRNAAAACVVVAMRIRKLRQVSPPPRPRRKA